MIRVQAEPIAIVPSGDSLGISLEALATADLGKAITLLGWHGSRVHESIHKGRKSLREARAILALGSAVLGPVRS